jgi:hypothetical protein
LNFPKPEIKMSSPSLKVRNMMPKSFCIAFLDSVRFQPVSSPMRLMIVSLVTVIEAFFQTLRKLDGGAEARLLCGGRAAADVVGTSRGRCGRPGRTTGEKSFEKSG